MFVARRAAGCAETPWVARATAVTARSVIPNLKFQSLGRAPANAPYVTYVSPTSFFWAARARTIASDKKSSAPKIIPAVPS